MLPWQSSGGIPNELLDRKLPQLAGMRTFASPDRDRLQRLLERADEVVAVDEGWARRATPPDRFLVMRHDMDHDVDNAVRFAQWESEIGVRSTYFVQQREWYWGPATGGGPSAYLLRRLDRIAALGHEIGLHNNAIALGLLTGQDPFRILERDLAALRRHGFAIRGSVGHGDAICRQVGFYNNELFSECRRPMYDAPDRLLEYRPRGGTVHRWQLRQRPMADFGLEYEANFLPHTIYLSDTGGRWSQPFDEAAAEFDRAGGFLQLLVHPVWWELDGAAAGAGELR